MKAALTDFDGTYDEFVQMLELHPKEAPYAVVLSATGDLPCGAIVQLEKRDGDGWHVTFACTSAYPPVDYKGFEVRLPAKVLKLPFTTWDSAREYARTYVDVTDVGVPEPIQSEISPFNESHRPYVNVLDAHFRDAMADRVDSSITEDEFSFLFSTLEASICNVPNLGQGCDAAVKGMRVALDKMLPQTKRYEYACRRYLTSKPVDTVEVDAPTSTSVGKDKTPELDKLSNANRHILDMKDLSLAPKDTNLA